MALPETSTNSTPSVIINRDISGQIAVGEGMIVQINTIYGGVVDIIPPAQLPTVKPRSTPVMIRPRRIAEMVDRKTELGAVVQAITSGAPVEFYGENGLGKTAMLRALAYHPVSAAFPDGVIYLLAHDQPVEDLIQCLYDAFFETSAPYKPSQAQIRLAVAPKRALILLDDFSLESNAIQTLEDVAPNCSFVLASKERRLWGEGAAFAIPGLPAEDAEELFRRELDRRTIFAEQQPIRLICSRLKGRPLYILQAGALARERQIPLVEMDSFLANGDPVERLNQALLHGLKKDEKNAVAMLAAVMGAPLPSNQMAELSKIPNLPQVLEGLRKRRIVEERNLHFNLADSLARFAKNAWQLENETQEMLAQITQRLESNPAGGNELIEPALRLMNWAAQQGRLENAIRLGKLLDPLLLMTGRWGAWETVLRQILNSAATREDPAVQAWAMHQLGIRALCLGDKAKARNLLVKALRLRRMLHDTAGVQVTLHNLDILMSGGAGKGDPDSGGGGQGGWPGRQLAGFARLVGTGLFRTLVLVVIMGLSIYYPPQPRSM